MAWQILRLGRPAPRISIGAGGMPDPGKRAPRAVSGGAAVCPGDMWQGMRADRGARPPRRPFPIHAASFGAVLTAPLSPPPPPAADPGTCPPRVNCTGAQEAGAAVPRRRAYGPPGQIHPGTRAVPSKRQGFAKNVRHRDRPARSPKGGNPLSGPARRDLRGRALLAPGSRGRMAAHVLRRYAFAPRRARAPARITAGRARGALAGRTLCSSAASGKMAAQLHAWHAGGRGARAGWRAA